jgi:hypothetical protein
MSLNQLPPYSLSGTCGIDDHAIAIIALYVHGSERVRNHRMELATPDLDLIKQAEQGRIMMNYRKDIQSLLHAAQRRRPDGN